GAPHLREIRVLILHSDPFIAAGLDAVLRKRRDLKVITARPGRSWEVVRPQSAETDVVIADYDSGLRLGSHGAASMGRGLILTHSDSESQICRALEHGARGYILVGCGPEELVKYIRSVYEGGVVLEPLVARRIAENMKQEPLTAREESVLRQLM